jgi:hypothetical protein
MLGWYGWSGIGYLGWEGGANLSAARPVTLAREEPLAVRPTTLAYLLDGGSAGRVPGRRATETHRCG